MKKFTYLLFLALGVTACSVESLDSTENLTVADARMTIQEALDPMGFYTGSGKNLKGSFSVWNDCDNLYVQILPAGEERPEEVLLGIFEDSDLPETSGNSGNVNTDNFLILVDSQNLIWTAELGEATTFNIFIKAYSHWAGNSSVEGIDQKFYTYEVEEVECACDESFNYSANEDGSYTFTYIPAEDMAEAEVVFTFAQSV